MKATVTLTFERETKGAVLYKEVSAEGKEKGMYDPGCAIGSLYIRKQILNGGKIPNTITVTLEG